MLRPVYDNKTLGGNNPSVLFMGILPSSALSGNQLISSTGFRQNKVTDVNLTLNGNSVNGYPMAIKHENCVFPLRLFNDVTNRYMNPLCGDVMNIATFQSNWLYSHNFEAEATSQGWIGVQLKTSAPFVEPATLVIWTVSRHKITIDRYHQVEKMVL